MPTLMLIIIFGVVVGSFLGMCTYRIPRLNSFYPTEDIPDTEIPEPVPFNQPKRSICPKCDRQLYWWHNIPIISWLILRGRCWFCSEPVSYRYPFIELASVLLALISYVTFGLTLAAVVAFLFSSALLVVLFIDLDHYIIPDLISLNGLIIGIIISILNSYFHFLPYPFNQTISDLIWGLLSGGFFLYVVSKSYLYLRKKDGLGLGDVKLLYMIGSFLGPQGALSTIIIGSFLGSFIGVTLIVLSKMKSSSYIAFGPYLVMGCYLYLYLQDDALNAIVDVVKMGVEKFIN